MAKKWNFGLIGCGGIGKFHAESLRELPNAQLAAVAGRSEEKTRKFAEAYGCDWTTDYRKILERSDIDIVCVTTASGSHYAIGREVLMAGKHAVIEKPVTMRTEEAQHLIDLASSRGLLLSVISQRRFEPHFQLLKRLIDQGNFVKLLLLEAGTPYFRTQEYYDSADWRGTTAEDGGALMNQGIHQIDLLLWLGGPAQSIYGKIATMTHCMEAEDMGVAVVKFTNGALGTIMSSTSLKPGFPTYIHIYGEKGTVKIVGQSIVHWSVEGVEAPRMDTQTSDGSSDPLAISQVYHQKQLEQLIRSLDNGMPPDVRGIDGKYAVQLIQGIYQSSTSGCEIILQ